jgi:hypothetical protein
MTRQWRRAIVLFDNERVRSEQPAPAVKEDVVPSDPCGDRGTDDPIAGCLRLPLERRPFHDLGDRSDVEMRVRIDHLDPLAADGHLATLRRGALRGLCERVVRETAGDAHARCRRCDGFDEVSSIAHHILLIRRPVKGRPTHIEFVV